MIGDGKPNRRYGALTLGALQLEGSPERLDHPPTERKTKAIVLAVFAGLAVELDKGLKAITDAIGRNTDPTINDLNYHPMLIVDRSQGHRSVLRCEPNGVVEESAQDIFQSVLVDCDVGKVLRYVDR